ncbi:Protein CBR-FBXA-137 [Caenorhabditis briggsae]|uniref:Protein CBR-FBXA-137 n=1 Tax=Caenorhabditis briggsae TaxID=6238 RepID=A8WPW5_CAEBR|nr:Protein CBR-FBXA-137 [Caenorhabditis briggsae]CAP22523.1 Protein CBR-FBXA-137 [Caenorhabditis briggsae]
MENGKIVTWQDLPMRFKVDVATLLDRDSRLAFQLTSRAENDIVSRCPINLKSLSISSFYCGKRPIPEKQQFSFRYCVQLPNDRVAVTEKRYIRDRAVEEFVRIFKHKKTTVKTLRLTAGRRMDDFLKNAVTGIVLLKKEQCPKFVIRVTEIDFHGNLVAEFCELLPFFDTSILMSIKIEGYDIEPEVVSMLVATEQFKKAKKVSIMPLVSVPIDNFLHLNTFEVKLASAKPEEVVKVVKNLGISESQNLRISESQNLRISESQNLRISESQNLRITESQNLRISESQNLRISESQNLRISESQNLRISESQNLRISESQNL